VSDISNRRGEAG